MSIGSAQPLRSSSRITARSSDARISVSLRARARARRSPAERHFCSRCGSALWLYDKRWPDLVHPFASAVDTPLPAPPRSTHIMLASKAPWVEPQFKRGDKRFDGYPDESIAEWHERQGLAREREG